MTMPPASAAATTACCSTSPPDGVPNYAKCKSDTCGHRFDIPPASRTIRCHHPGRSGTAST